jgi:hypothetical protein
MLSNTSPELRLGARNRRKAVSAHLGRSPNWGSRLSNLPRTIVYVDGFNFYYAAFRRARFQE